MKDDTDCASVTPPKREVLQELPPLAGKIDDYFLARFNGGSIKHDNLNGPIKKALPYKPVSAFRQLSQLHPKEHGKRLPGKRFPKYTRKNQLCQEVELTHEKSYFGGNVAS